MTLKHELPFGMLVSRSVTDFFQRCLEDPPVLRHPCDSMISYVGISEQWERVRLVKSLQIPGLV